MYGNVYIPLAYASVQGVYQRLMALKKHWHAKSFIFCALQGCNWSIKRA